MNTKKGLARKRKRKMEKVHQSLRAKQLEALALKQWKVSVITIGMHNRTVMAADEQSAVDEVMKGQGGRDAGTEGPTPFAFRVQDMAIIQPPVTLQQVMAEIGRGDVNKDTPEQAKPKSIITPGG